MLGAWRKLLLDDRLPVAEPGTDGAGARQRRLAELAGGLAARVEAQAQEACGRLDGRLGGRLRSLAGRVEAAEQWLA